MHTPEQSPEQFSQHLSAYELAEKHTPPDGEQDAQASTFAQESTTPFSDEDIRKGLIYPPPPSFYQKERLAPQASRTIAPPLPRTQKEEPKAVLPPHLPPAHISTPRSSVPVPPPLSVPKRKSRAWIWIVVSVLGLSMIASCGLLSWVSYTLSTGPLQEDANVIATINDYYTRLQARQPDLAYMHLARVDAQTGLSKDQFIQQAQEQDERYGPVLSYSAGTPDFPRTSQQEFDLSRCTINIDVGRKGSQYKAKLTLHTINKEWKIVSYSRL